ncbi:TetR/AcrR family transcriptional regulator [Brevibacterium oceani]|uniref:TetR/AcrR family transcriptional regulator n=1 Tax=Brevibacterium oceani TaxID=358099 RepID=UPI001B32EF3A|nr:TetR/AcrR family transcriptional regulator [Brevibacterium oceani]
MAQTAVKTTRSRSGPATRERIIEAANEMFYAQGIHSTSADRIIAQVGITKVTFYRHFPTKSNLVETYLRRQAEGEREWFSSMRRADDPVGTLHAIAAGISAASCEPGFRGCAFINAAAEFPDPESPVRNVVDEHRGWMLSEFADIASEAEAADPESVARQLMIVRDGAMVNGYLGEPTSSTESLHAAFDSVITAGR